MSAAPLTTTSGASPTAVSKPPKKKPAGKPHRHDHDRPKNHRKKPAKHPNRTVIIGDPASGFVVVYDGDRFVVRHPPGLGRSVPRKILISGVDEWEILITTMPR